MSDNTRQTSIKHFLGENRIFLILAFVFAVMAVWAPRFLTMINQASIFKSMGLYALPAIGFTIVMLSGKLDLSIGSVVTLGGVITIGLQPHIGWAGSITLAAAAGGLVGLFNGIFVARVKVDSFIVTLASMIIVQGLVLRICGGGTGTFTVQDFTVGDFLENRIFGLLSFRVIFTIMLVIMFEVFLKMTRQGRGFYAVGANPSMAWHAGLPVDGYVITAFIISGMTSGLGGALFSITINSAPPTMGAPSLIIVVAATIIGGTSMAGGKGSVLKTMVAIYMLSTLFNGLSCMGAGYEIRQIASGIVLAAVIVYDAWLTVMKNRIKGRRHELMDEAENLNLESYSEGTDKMSKNDNTAIMITAMVVTGCVTIVAIMAMVLRPAQPPVQPVYTAQMPAGVSQDIRPVQAADVKTSREPVDPYSLKGSDGQPLIVPAADKTIPAPPENASALTEEDPMHWYDMEYAGWNIQKAKMPASPADGPEGKNVIFLKMVDHPYNTAYSNGLQMMADAFGVNVKTKVANNDINIQSQQVDEAINEQPDMVIINAVDAQACLPLMKRMNDAGLPVIASNLLISDEAMKYCLAWTGPDDWGQMRKLAREFARKMNYKGGYCIVQHRPGSSPYFARTWSAVTELKKIAPDMKVLDMQTTDLEAEKSMQVVSDWITRFGTELNGIFSADDSGTQIGINEAVRTAGREDIVRVAAGNSKVGMDFIKSDQLSAITYQTAEGDGALAMHMAIEWFNGTELPPIRYLPIRIITKENVEKFYPPQW